MELLGDPTELTAEMASRGMTLVYRLGDEEAKKVLVQGLVGTLSGSANRKNTKAKLTGDSEVFGAGTMGSIAAWETVAGAVTDVAQRVDAVSDGDVVNVQNEVSVSLRSRADAVGLPLPPLALLGVDDDDVLTLRITQRFESRTQSRGRLSTHL